MKIKASCEMNVKTVKAQAHLGIYGTKNPKRRLIMRTLLFLFLASLVAAQIFLLGWSWPFIAMAAVLTVAIFLEYLWYFGTPKRKYQALGDRKDKEVAYCFADEEVTVEDRVLRYKDLWRIMETKEYLFLYVDRGEILPVEKATLRGGTPEQLTKQLKKTLEGTGKYITCAY